MADEMIAYDPSGVFLPKHGISPADLAGLGDALDEVRDEVLADAQLWADDVDVAAAKRPLDAGFHELPDRLLGEFRSLGAKSEVARSRRRPTGSAPPSRASSCWGAAGRTWARGRCWRRAAISITTRWRP